MIPKSLVINCILTSTLDNFCKLNNSCKQYTIFRGQLAVKLAKQVILDSAGSSVMYGNWMCKCYVCTLHIRL